MYCAECECCPLCGETETYTKQKGPHIGLYCKGCNRWIKWIQQNKKIQQEDEVFESYKVSNDDDTPPWEE